MKQQIKKIEPSDELKKLIEEWATCYIKSIDLPIHILKQAQDEGLTKAQTKKLIVEALTKRHLSDRRIREILPTELKDLSKTRKSNIDFAAESAAKEDVELEAELKNMETLPVTTPNTIIMKSEGELAEDQYKKELESQAELTIKTAEVQPLIDNHILTEEQVYKWVNNKYQESFQIPKDINITQGAYHARLSPAQAVSQIKQLGNSVKALEIGWRIIG
jgi:hypothetical protein